MLKPQAIQFQKAAQDHNEPWEGTTGSRGIGGEALVLVAALTLAS